MFESKTDGAVELVESELDHVHGGLLLPAVQKVREAAARMSCMTAEDATASFAAG